MAKTLSVKYNGQFAYSIRISADFSELLPLSKEAIPDPGKKGCIITDDHVGPLYADEIQQELGAYYADVLSYTFPSGEENKNLDTICGLYEFLIQNHFGRKDFLVALGGGVVGDMTGFAAATFLRGIDFIQIPTTLLSQVDSSIGGKTGVDFLSYKNMVGAFHMPKLVYINTRTLETLPPVQFASGMGEVIKYGLIQRVDFFAWLGEHAAQIRSQEAEALEEMIGTSCECKREVVEEDPTEQGIRAILNFGHTIGHAIEKCSNFSLLHGQCVGLGMIAAAAISKEKGTIDDAAEQSILQSISDFSLPTQASGLSADAVLTATKSDKKVISGRVRFILLEEIGKAKIDPGLSDEELLVGIRKVLQDGGRICE